MPLRLVPPRQGKSPNWTIRGSYLKVHVDKSCGTDRKSVARQRLEALERAIECGDFPERQPAPGAPTFLSAAVAYMQAGRPGDFLDRLILHFGEIPISEIDQAAVDAAAIAILPNAKPATRNRKVYTPTSAVLHHAGFEGKLRRPKGAKGQERTNFLRPEDAAAIIDAADHQEGRRFGALLRFLLYTGCRISEAMNLRWQEVDLDQRLAYIRFSKNEDPRTTLLREDLCAALAEFADERSDGPVFPFPRGGGLKDRLVRARLVACGLPIPKRGKGETKQDRRPPPHRLSWVTFHTFRHTWATWMRRYGGADLQTLVATGNWRDPRSAKRYAHVAAGEEWARVDRLPAVGGKSVVHGKSES